MYFINIQLYICIIKLIKHSLQMIRTEKFSAWHKKDHSSNDSSTKTARLEKRRSFTSTTSSNSTGTVSLNSVLTIAVLALVLIGSYLNGQLFFKELAAASAIVLLVLLVKSKS